MPVVEGIQERRTGLTGLCVAQDEYTRCSSRARYQNNSPIRGKRWSCRTFPKQQSSRPFEPTGHENDYLVQTSR